MPTTKTLKKWWEIYPKGTQAGDEEKKFFVSIARHAQFKFRSVVAIATETGLTKTRTEEIVQKYWQAGMLFQNPKKPDQWGYWETIGYDPNTKTLGVADADKAVRLKKASSKKP